MTQKELLYMEDAIKHEENIIDVLDIMIQNGINDEFVSFSKKELEKHEEMLDGLNCLMEEKANE